MLRPAKMCKVRLIGPKSRIRATIESLEQYGGTEIKKINSKNLAYENFSEHDELVEKLIRVEGLEKSLKEEDKKGTFNSTEIKKFLKSKEFTDTEQAIIRKNREMQKLEDELENLADKRRRLKLFSKFGIDFGKLKAETLTVYAGICTTSASEKVKKLIEEMGTAKYTNKAVSKDTTAFIIAAPKQSESAIESLSKAGFERISMPKIESTASKELEKTEKEKQRILQEIEKAKKELQKIAGAEHSKIAAAKEYLQMETGKSNVAGKFGTTEHAFLIEAYLPEKKYAEFTEFVKKEFNGKIEVKKFSSKELMERHEETPTLLEHPAIMKPFLFMTKFVSIPKSNELDPTLIFTIFFPLFYAMMVGDVIYGLISFLLASFINSKVDEGNILHPVSKIWMWSAIPTVIFGIIFDEFAGMSHAHLAEKVFGLHHFALYHGLERIHNIETIMVITILFGVFTMAFGFLLGFWNAMSHGDKKHGVAKLGWFGIVSMGTVVVSAAMFGAYPEIVLYLALGAMLVSIGAVVKNEGVIALMEIPSAVGNILSFARILAVGLVGAVIALILNDLAFPSMEQGLLLIVIIPLFIIGHIFNAFLAMFESLIQGARLNYVEFYSKFYEGGGKEFNPFRFSRKYIKE